MNNWSIKGISYFLPEKVVTNNDLANDFPGFKIDELTRLTGVLERHIADKDENASDLGVKACEKLFDEYNIKREEIDFILYCTQIGDYYTPSTSCIIQDRLGIPKRAGTLDFNQGCTGFVYGLNIASGLIASETAKNILLVTSVTISKLIHPQDKSNRAIFGDGAAATLITSEPGDLKYGKFVFGTDGSGFDSIIIKHGGEKYPIKEFESDDFIDEFENVRNDACFYMNGSSVFTFSVETVPQMIDQLLELNGLKKEDIDLYVLHQANRIILESIFRKSKIPADKYTIDLDYVGNTVASTIPIALKNAISSGRVKKGDKVLLAGFGVGFSWGGTIISF